MSSGNAAARQGEHDRSIGREPAEATAKPAAGIESMLDAGYVAWKGHLRGPVPPRERSVAR